MPSERNLLRSLIQEAIKVKIMKTYPDPSGGSRERTIVDQTFEDDEAVDLEELRWFVDKYRHKPIDWDKPKKGEKKKLDVGSAKALNDVIQLLVDDPKKRSLLLEVIEPWGQVGFDALRRIYSASVQSADEPGSTSDSRFPFFEYASDLVPGGLIPLPGLPTPSTEKFLMNSMTRIGRNPTGRGELLLSLLTGAVAGRGAADLRLGDTDWEVKDSRTGPTRLGDLASSQFEKSVVDAAAHLGALGKGLPPSSAALPPGSSSTVAQVKEVMGMLRGAKNFRGRPKEFRDEINKILRDVIKNIGFAVVTNEGFKLYSSKEVEFYFLSGETQNRVHVKFKSSASE